MLGYTLLKLAISAVASAESVGVHPHQLMAPDSDAGIFVAAERICVAPACAPAASGTLRHSAASAHARALDLRPRIMCPSLFAELFAMFRRSLSSSKLTVKRCGRNS